MVERLFGGFTMEDKKITEMFLNREESAISELTKKYGRLFRNLAFNVVGNEEDAEECVNDSCMEIWNAIPPANPDILLAFACKIVRRVSINRLRFNIRQKRNCDMTVPIEELSECLSGTDEMEHLVNSTHFKEVINVFLHSLDEDSRNLFVKRYFFFESLESLAEHFGVSENKISVRLHRIRKKLALKLKEEGIYE